METGDAIIQEPVSTKTHVEESPAGVVLDHPSMEVDKANLSTVLNDEITNQDISPREADVVNGSGNKETEDIKIVNHETETKNTPEREEKIDTISKPLVDNEPVKVDEGDIEKSLHSTHDEQIKTDDVKEEKDSITFETSTDGDSLEPKKLVLVEVEKEEDKKNVELSVDETEKEKIVIETPIIQGEHNESIASLEDEAETDKSSKDTEVHEDVLEKSMPQSEILLTETEAVDTSTVQETTITKTPEASINEKEAVHSLIVGEEEGQQETKVDTKLSSDVQAQEFGERTEPQSLETKDESQGREEPVDVPSTESETPLASNTESEQPRGLNLDDPKAEIIDQNRTDKTEENQVGKLIALPDIESVEQIKMTSLDSSHEVSEEASTAVDEKIVEKQEEEEEETLHQESQEGSYELETKEETVSVAASKELGDKSHEEESKLEKEQVEKHEPTNEEVAIDHQSLLEEKTGEVINISSSALPSEEREGETVVEAETIEETKTNEEEKLAEPVKFNEYDIEESENIQTAPEDAHQDENAEPVEAIKASNDVEKILHEVTGDGEKEEDLTTKTEEVPESPAVIEMPTKQEEDTESKASEDTEEHVLVRDTLQIETLLTESETVNTSTVQEAATPKAVETTINEPEAVHSTTIGGEEVVQETEKDTETSLDLNDDKESVEDKFEDTVQEMTEEKRENLLDVPSTESETIKDNEPETALVSSTESRESDLAFKVDKEEFQDDQVDGAQTVEEPETQQTDRNRTDETEVRPVEKLVALPDLEPTEQVKKPSLESSADTQTMEEPEAEQTNPNRTEETEESPVEKLVALPDAVKDTVEKIQKPSLESPSEITEETNKTIDEKIDEKAEEVTPHQEGQEKGSFGLDTKEETVSVPVSLVTEEKAKEIESSLPKEEENETKLQTEQIEKHEPAKEGAHSDQESPVEEKSDELLQVSSASSLEEPRGETVVEADKVEEVEKIQRSFESVEIEELHSSLPASSEEQDHGTDVEVKKTEDEKVTEAEPTGDMSEKDLEIPDTRDLSLPSSDLKKEEIKAFNEETQISSVTSSLDEQENVTSAEKGEKKEMIEEPKQDKSQELSEDTKATESTGAQTLPIETLQVEQTPSSEFVQELDDQIPKQNEEIGEEVPEEEHKLQAEEILPTETLPNQEESTEEKSKEISETTEETEAIIDETPKQVEEIHEDETKEPHKLQEEEEFLPTKTVPIESFGEATVSRLASEDHVPATQQESHFAGDTQEEQPVQTSSDSLYTDRDIQEPAAIITKVEDEITEEAPKLEESKEDKIQEVPETTEASDPNLPIETAQANQTLSSDEVSGLDDQTPKQVEKIHEEEPKEEHEFAASGDQILPVETSQADQTQEDLAPKQFVEIREKSQEEETSEAQKLKVEADQTPLLVSEKDEQTSKQVEEINEEEKKEVQAEEILPTKTLLTESFSEAPVSVLASREEESVTLQEGPSAGDIQEEQPVSAETKEKEEETKPKESEPEGAEKSDDQVVTTITKIEDDINEEQLEKPVAPKLEESKEDKIQEISETTETTGDLTLSNETSQADQTLSSELVSGLNDQTPRQVEHIHEEETKDETELEATSDQILPVETLKTEHTPSLVEETHEKNQEEEHSLQVADDPTLPVETSQTDEIPTLVEESHEKETKEAHKLEDEEILQTEPVSEAPVFVVASREDEPVTLQEGDTQEEQPLSAETEPQGSEAADLTNEQSILKDSGTVQHGAITEELSPLRNDSPDYPTEEVEHEYETSSTLPVVGILQGLHTTLDTERAINDSAAEVTPTSILKPDETEKSKLQKEDKEEVKVKDDISREFEINVDHKSQEEETREITETQEEPKTQQEETNASTAEKTSKQEETSEVPEDQPQPERKTEIHETVSEDVQDEKVKGLSVTRDIEEIFPSELKEDKEDVTELGVGHDFVLLQAEKEEEPQIEDPEVIIQKAKSEHEPNEEHVEPQAISDDKKSNKDKDFPTEQAPKDQTEEVDADKPLTKGVIVEQIQVPPSALVDDQDLSVKKPSELIQPNQFPNKVEEISVVTLKEEDGNLIEDKGEVEYMKTEMEDAIKHRVFEKETTPGNIDREVTREVYQEENKQINTIATIKEEIREEEELSGGSKEIPAEKKIDEAVLLQKEINQESSNSTKNTDDEIEKTKIETREIDSFSFAVSKTQDISKQEDEETENNKGLVSEVKETEPTVTEPARNSLSLSDIIHKGQETKKTEDATTEPHIEEETPKTDEEEGEDGDEHKDDKTSPDSIVMVEAKDTVSVVKTPHKGILSGVGAKVKHSIIKVKKALTGKSSSHTTKPTSPK